MKLIPNLSLILTISCDFCDFSLFKVHGFNFKTEWLSAYPRIAAVKNTFAEGLFYYNLFTWSCKARKRCYGVNASVLYLLLYNGHENASAFGEILAFSSDSLTLPIFQFASSVNYIHTKG